MTIRARILDMLRTDPERVARVLALLTPVEGAVVSSPASSVDVVRPLLLGREAEALVCAALDRRGRVVDVAVLTTGSHAFCIVDPAMVLRWVLTRNRPASSFVLAHNHPSGDPTPSAQDIEVTRRVGTAARAVGLTLLDHVVISDAAHASLAERGDWLGTYPGAPLVTG